MANALPVSSGTIARHPLNQEFYIVSWFNGVDGRRVYSSMYDANHQMDAVRHARKLSSLSYRDVIVESIIYDRGEILSRKELKGWRSNA